MKRFFEEIHDFITYSTFPCFLKKCICDAHSVSDENWLLQKIKPVINNETMSDKEKIEILKNMIENYNPLEY